MRKRIGVKVFLMVLVLAVLFAFNSYLNNAALRDLKGKNKELIETYVPMSELAGRLEADVTNLKLLANLAALTENSGLSLNIAGELEADVAEIQSELDTMGQYCDQTGDASLKDAFLAYRENVELFCAAVPEMKEKLLAGEQAEANGIIDSLYEAIMANEELLAVYTDMINEDVRYAEERINVKVDGTILFTLIVLIVYLLLVVVVMLIIMKIIVNPARRASTHLNEMIDKMNNSEGDLTERLPVKTKDEVGQLVSGINGFLEHLQHIMQKIQTESANIRRSVDNTLTNVSESNNNAENVSATMEELAASMEEVSATLDNIAAGSQELVDAVQAMNNEAASGAGLVEEIRQRAEKVNQETQESKSTADHMVNEIRGMVKAAVEESRSVEKINGLTEDILDISSQTNLLALNASIEAARAGEAGKGFAVVADEIRVLADNSRNTANDIQNISQQVTGAVERLAKNAEDMLTFIDKKVLKDYDSFVDVADKYHDDADSVNKIIQEFARNTANMEMTMRGINDGISGISTTVDESARGVANAAESAGQLVEAISLIQTETQTNQDISNQLSQEVERFKHV